MMGLTIQLFSQFVQPLSHFSFIKRNRARYVEVKSNHPLNNPILRGILSRIAGVAQLVRAWDS
jgi:hypothetical protein